MTTIVVLISGRGSNFEAIARAGIRGVRIAAVVSNRPGASGLAVAESLGIATRVVDHRAYASRTEFDAALTDTIDGFAPELIVLAGFMRILSDDFVRRYEGRLLNVHPSLLPSFPGVDTHARALAEGVRVHGATVHFVTAELDRGPIVIQAVTRVRDGDTPDALADRVLRLEHVIYPRAVQWFAEGKLRLVGGHVAVDVDAGQTALFDTDGS